MIGEHSAAGCLVFERRTHRLPLIAFVGTHGTLLDQGEFEGPAGIVEVPESGHRCIVCEGKIDILYTQTDHRYHRIFIPVVDTGCDCFFPVAGKIVLGIQSAYDFI